MTGGATTDVPAAYLALREDARALLRGWEAPDAQQDALRRDYLTHLDAHPDGMWKQGPSAHLTTGAIVLDETLGSVLLTLHKKAGMWLQFGGHLEPEDPSVLAAATREAREESGLPWLELDPRVVELHRHELIAPAFGRCREHLDVRFAGVVPAAAEFVVSEESHDVAWWPVDDLPPESAHEIGPMVRAAQVLLGRG